MMVLGNGSHLKEAGHWLAFMGAISCLRPFLYFLVLNLVLTWLGLWASGATPSPCQNGLPATDYQDGISSPGTEALKAP